MSARSFRLSALICVVTVALSALTACATASRQAALPVLVSVAPVQADAGYAALSYQIAFNGDADGLTTLSLPDQWGGATELWRSVRDLTAEGGTLMMGPAPNSATLAHAPGTRITLRYHIVQVQPGEPQAGPSNEYRPLIQKSYFQVFGATAFIGIDHLTSDTPVIVTLPAPSNGATIASDLQHNGGAVTWRDLFESTIVGGDFRVLGSPDGLRVAIRGTWPRGDDAWRKSVERISAAQAAYWREPDKPYLATVLPVSGGAGTIVVGGTGLGDAFAFFATTNAPGDRIDEVLSHEKTHTWVPGLLGRIPKGMGTSQELAWLSEGFADWVSWRGLVRSGIWTQDTLVASINQGMREYDVSPLRNAPNAETAHLFHREAEAQRHPYRKGMLIALRWNELILRATNGRKNFDDVLVAMRKHAQDLPDVEIIANLIDRTREISGVDITADLREAIQAGATIALPAELFGGCVRIDAITEPVFERGYDPVATQRAGGVVTGLDPASRAYSAGLRNGMRLVRRLSGVTGDATQPLRFEVESAGRVMEVSWLPQGAKTETFRRLSLPRSAAAACVASFG